MKQTLTLVLVLVLSLLSGCSEDTVTAPGADDADTHLVSQTIGAAGGTLEDTGFTLSVPAGAFDSDRPLDLYASRVDRPFGPGSVSRMFRIEGLPREYHQPLRVSVAHDAALSGASFVAVGEEVRAPGMGGLTTGYLLCSAADSSGFLTCELPVPEAVASAPLRMPAGASDRQNPPTRVQAVTNQAFVDTEHFRVIAGAAAVTRAALETTGEYLENAYVEFKDRLGFSYDARTRWPLQVSVRDFGGGRESGVFSQPTSGVDYSHIALKSSLLDDQAEDQQLRVTAGHEFFHFVQSLYRPRQLSHESALIWMDEATATWSEERFIENPDDRDSYVPEVRAENELSPFNGLQAGVGVGEAADAENHGYGMSAVIKHLVTQYGDGLLLAVYRQVRSGTHPIDALVGATAASVDWLEPFFREFVLGNIYSAETYALDYHGVHVIRSGGDWLHRFEDSYPDLSARLHLIIPDQNDIDPTAAITFSTDTGGRSDVEITVLKMTGGVARFLTHGASQVSISNLSGITEERSSLLALVTNSRETSPYTGTTGITLSVEVSAGERYTRCSFAARVYAQVRREDWTGVSQDWQDRSVPSVGPTVEGSMTGNVFTGSSRATLLDADLTATFSEDRSRLLTAHWDVNRTNAFGEIFHDVVDIANVPVWRDDGSRIIFGVNGEVSCAYLTQVSYDARGDGWTEDLLGHECNEQSHINLVFDEN